MHTELGTGVCPTAPHGVGHVLGSPSAATQLADSPQSQQSIGVAVAADVGVAVEVAVATGVFVLVGNGVLVGAGVGVAVAGSVVGVAVGYAHVMLIRGASDDDVE